MHAEPHSTAASRSVVGADELDVLAYFHYAMGILIAMLALVPGVFLFAGRELAARAGEEIVLTEGARATGAFTTVLFLLLVGFGLLVGALVVYGGRCLARRRGWRLCVLTSVVACLFFPLGTLLGGITLSYLTRRENRALFAS